MRTANSRAGEEAIKIFLDIGAHSLTEVKKTLENEDVAKFVKTVDTQLNSPEKHQSLLETVSRLPGLFQELW